MIENILDVDAWRIEASIISNDGALLLFDFVAAFPSLSRSFLWLALGACGIPTFIIRATYALYTNNR